jgi:hypothetical protein
LGNLPCFVSYILVGLAGVLVLMLLWGLYKKMCGGAEAKKPPPSNPHTGPSPVDLALMASGTGAMAAQARMMQQQRQQYGHQAPTPPALRPKGKYELMEEQMRGMSNQQVAAQLGTTHSPIIRSPPPMPMNSSNGVGPPPTISPGARFIGNELQQLSPREAPMALQLTRRASAVYNKDFDDFDL